MDWDVFISHAWEDKEDIARLLAEALRRKGLRVWYDEFTLTLGASLRRSIDRGLAQSRYGVVILSPNFFPSYYSQRPRHNPPGPDSGEGRVLRGGSYGNNLHDLRSAYRDWFLPDRPMPGAGFRCARSSP